MSWESHCPESGGKVRYKSEEIACASLLQLQKMKAMSGLADIYQCDFCNDWHFTSAMNRGDQHVHVKSFSRKSSKGAAPMNNFQPMKKKINPDMCRRRGRRVRPTN